MVGAKNSSSRVMDPLRSPCYGNLSQVSQQQYSFGLGPSASQETVIAAAEVP